MLTPTVKVDIYMQVAVASRRLDFMYTNTYSLSLSLSLSLYIYIYILL